MIQQLTVASPQSPNFGRRRAQTEGEADNTLSAENSKPWAKLTARLRSLAPVTPQCETQYHYNQYARRSQTPTAEMIRRHQLEEDQPKRQDHPYLAKHKKLSRAVSMNSPHGGLRPPPRRMSSQSSRHEIDCGSVSGQSSYASFGRMTVDISSAQSDYSAKGTSPKTPKYSPLPTPPNSAAPNPTFSPPERIRRSWSGHREYTRQHAEK